MRRLGQMHVNLGSCGPVHKQYFFIAGNISERIEQARNREEAHNAGGLRRGIIFYSL